jgi:hypothetical protein
MPTYRERVQKNEGKRKIVREWSREQREKGKSEIGEKKTKEKGNKRERGHEKEEKRKIKREGTRER